MSTFFLSCARTLYTDTTHTVGLPMVSLYCRDQQVCQKTHKNEPTKAVQKDTGECKQYSIYNKEAFQMFYN